MFQLGDYTSIKSIKSSSDINKFENHYFSISVNVLGYENLVYPVRISEHNYKRERALLIFY